MTVAITSMAVALAEYKAEQAKTCREWFARALWWAEQEDEAGVKLCLDYSAYLEATTMIKDFDELPGLRIQHGMVVV